MRETTTSISTPDSPKPQLKQLALIHLSLILVQLGFASLHVEGKWVMGPDFQVTPFALAMTGVSSECAAESSFVSAKSVSEPDSSDPLHLG